MSEKPSQKDTRPGWVPENAGKAEGFTTSVMSGIESLHDGLKGSPATAPPTRPLKRRRDLTLDEYVDGVLAGHRGTLARAITLVESSAEHHQQMAQEMLTRLLPHRGKSIRVGITGVPGAGKSTLIEAIGEDLCSKGHKIAVLAVDPSSSRTGGSILGDKTRMEQLSRNPNAFIRPSPTGGALGGVARKSREAMIVCEAAGFDLILVETVGVGQSEVTVRSMVDFFMLVQIAGAGDDLQGIKKGVMELSDMIIVNKADGDNITRANTARAELEQVLHYLQPATEGWTTPVLACSAVSKLGLDELWQTILRYRETTTKSGLFDRRRQDQNIEWIHNLIREHLNRSFHQHPAIRKQLPLTEAQVRSENLSPTAAAKSLLELFEKNPFPKEGTA